LRADPARPIVNNMVKHSEAALDTTLKALADPTRRGIVQMLAHRASTPTELGASFPISAPAMSRHLRILEGAGIVARRRAGRVHHLALVPRRIEEAAAWIAHYRTFWERQLDRLESFLDQQHPEPKEESSWRPPRKGASPRSSSAARSDTRRNASSTRGRRPKR
jgi:DNA-binding transcriptional ArsR family regulator